ncbi:hypothetical protein [Nucisporomicrobium flavum]|uniref:hypothetical protein n=1 Tax=Nucisporomicrobium flavum TaxID=2785915 RepID=UPI0018F468B1|nr:hypothetical protein [Nucisporomicrobium flavum]
MGDLLINLLASVIAGSAVWLAQFAVRRRRLDRERAFFGLAPGAGALLVASRHFSSPSDDSVHRRDVAALVELATLVRECGARADVVGGAELRQELGRVTEFCVGGPSANPRAAVHLRTALPGVEYRPDEKNIFVIGTTRYANSRDVRYAVLARFRAPTASRPVYFLGGLSSDGNLAAARHLADHHRDLFRQYGADRPFCLVLRIREPEAYGTDFTELAADVSDVAFTPAGNGED